MGFGPTGPTVQGWGPDTPSIHSDTHVSPWAHSLSRHRIRTCAHTQHVTSTRVPLSVAPPSPNSLATSGTPGDTQKLFRGYTGRVGRESTYRPSSLCFFPKMDLPERKLLVPLSHLTPPSRKMSLFPILCFFYAQPWGVEASRVPCRRDPSQTLGSRARLWEHSRDGVSTNPVGVFPPGHRPVAKCQALSVFLLA